jgi:uncharacterized protein with PIN domain
LIKDSIAMTNHATFRFYDELNDFLPLTKRYSAFIHSFEGAPSIKDIIEAIGIPHVEVNLIKVNDQPVDFAYRLKDNDIVSVHPVSETSVGQTKRDHEIKFILDVHLGKLAKYLRLCGFDSLYQNDYDDKEIIEISIKENRTILTRDLGLLKVKSVSQGYFIRNQNSKAQLIEVLKRFDLYQDIHAFSRCVKCNGKVEAIKKEKIIEKLEPLTRKYFHKFFRCTNCHTIYWKGSHFDRMNSFINTIRNSENY